MTRKQASASFLSLSAVSAMIACGCAAKDPVSSGPGANTLGAVSIRIAVGAQSPFKSIARDGDITITAADMAPLVSKLILGDSTVEGKVTGIPTGKARKLDVKVYDSAGTVRYQGSASTDIVADSTLPVSLTLFRKTGSTTVTGSVSETDTIAPPDSTPWGPATRVNLGAQGHSTLGSVLDFDSAKAWTSVPAYANQAGIDLVFLFYQGAFHLDNAVQAKAAGVANSINLTLGYDTTKIKDIFLVRIAGMPADRETARLVFAAGTKIKGSVITAGDRFLAESTEGKLVMVTVVSVSGTDKQGAAEVDLNPLTLP